jgi:hypothetical protein
MIEKEGKRNIRQSDKLDYADVMTALVKKALISKDPEDVETVRDAMYFNKEGLPFKEIIDKKEKELQSWYKLEIRIFIHEHSSDIQIYYPGNPFNRIMDIKYYKKLMNFLIQTLAEFNALVEPETWVERGKESSDEQ